MTVNHTTMDVFVSRSTKQSICLQAEERSLLLIMADFVREDKDEFFWPKQDSQPYLSEPDHTEEELHVLKSWTSKKRS